MLITTREVECLMQSFRKKFRGLSIVSLPVAILAMALAIGSSAQQVEGNEQGSESGKNAIKEISKVLGTTTKEISDAPLSDFQMVEMDNGRIAYTKTDGEYAFVGDLYGWTDQRFVNLTQIQKSKALLSMFTSLPEVSTINYSPEEGEDPAVVYVFTDVDCGYCRLLHEHMAEYHAQNIEIRYLGYPRAGINSRAYNRLVSAWCAEDRHDVLARVKNGTAVNEEEYSVNSECAENVDKHYELGQKIEITGTPTNVLPNGKVVPGFTQAADLRDMIDS